VLSAWGMAHADALADRVRTVLAPLTVWGARERRAALTDLAALAADELVAAGHDRARISYETSLSLRYRGQSFELALADTEDAAARFHAAHAERYGWRLDDHPVDLVHLRARASVRTSAAAGASTPAESAAREARDAQGRSSERAVERARSAVLDGVRASVPVVDRASLAPGAPLLGPAIIEEFTATTLVPPGYAAELRAGGHLWLWREVSR